MNEINWTILMNCLHHFTEVHLIYPMKGTQILASHLAFVAPNGYTVALLQPTHITARSFPPPSILKDPQL
jgi:hypothetical protein